jgi:hypothetical protein
MIDPYLTSRLVIEARNEETPRPRSVGGIFSRLEGIRFRGELS